MHAVARCLHCQLCHQQVEFVVLVNKTGQIVVASHSTAVAGTAYNPSKIVSDVLTTGLSFTRSGLVAASELQRFNAPVWTDKLIATTPNSTLHPLKTGAESLIRWTGTPLW